MTSSAAKTTGPAGSTNLSGIGGAFWYALTVSRISTAKPAAMVTIAATLHHGDSDSIGPVVASAIVPSRRHYIHCAKYPLPQTFGPFSQMVKLHLVDHLVHAAITLLLHRYDWESSASVSVKVSAARPVLRS